MARRPWTEHPKVIATRQRSAPVNALVRMAEHFRTHRTGRNAALVAHYGFLSVFPLMLVFTTVLGLVLQHHASLRERIADSAFNRIPIIGNQIATEPERLTGNVVVLVVGLAGTLWAGMKAFNVLQSALDDIAEVPLDDRPTLLTSRLRSLMGIAVVGGGQVGTAVLTSFVGVTGVMVVHKTLLTLAAVAVNAMVLAATYRWLCSRPPTWQQAWPGALAAGVVFAGLQLLGTAVVGRAIAHASPVYGTFASVIALLSWLSLHSTVALVGAELNGVLPARRLDGTSGTTAERGPG